MATTIHDSVNLKDAVISPSGEKPFKLIIYRKIEIDTLGVYLLMLLSGRVTNHTPIMQTGKNASMSELNDPEILCINCGFIPRCEGNFCNNGSATATEQAFQVLGLEDMSNLGNLVKYISTPTPDSPQDIATGSGASILPAENAVSSRAQGSDSHTHSVEKDEPKDLYLKPLIGKMVKDVEKEEQMEEGVNILQDVLAKNLDPFKPLPPEYKTLYKSPTALEFKLGSKGVVTNLQDVTGSMVVAKKRISNIRVVAPAEASVVFKSGNTGFNDL